MEPAQCGQHPCTRACPYVAGHHSGVPSETCPYTGLRTVFGQPVPSGLISDTTPPPGPCPCGGHYITREGFSIPSPTLAPPAVLCPPNGTDARGMWEAYTGDAVEDADEDALFTASVLNSGDLPPAPPPSPAQQCCQMHAHQLQEDMQMANYILQSEYIPLTPDVDFPPYTEQPEAAELLSEQTVTTGSVPTDGGDGSRKRKADWVQNSGTKQEEQSSRIPVAPQSSPVQSQQSSEQDATHQSVNGLGLIHGHMTKSGSSDGT